MKQHLISGAVAAAISTAVAVGVVHHFPAKIERIEAVYAVSKHAWPALSDEEKAAVTEVAKTLPKGVKIDIVCNDAGCSDLAADIDDALEDAGIESMIDKAIGPLGYGIGIQVNEFDKPAAEKAIEMLKYATDGRLDPGIVEGKSPPGYVSIIIGKRPR